MRSRPPRSGRGGEFARGKLRAELVGRQPGKTITATDGANGGGHVRYRPAPAGFHHPLALAGSRAFPF
jgi:hypothetical protein